MVELLDDPLWYKDAVIYELHVRAFQDSNGDGIGDLTGLISKLDYLSDLGVTAVWLLPFYPSPLKDGGYDIADYTSVHEHYGTRADIARLLQEAHRRGMRVITELVLNHTSSEHPWFQRARRAPPGSSARDFYVWSDTPTRYEDARIIFKDYETSNWSWDPVAKAYYWHRFYSHQPDLNFDNPAVHEALFGVIDYWFELGVDGLRLDAVPYLYEREGTSCENLPETHAFLRELRAHIDAKFKNRMLLAEANQWVADAAAYFGAGDECHMNFHFPLMPRMFMAIELEDSFAITNILRRTPKVPEICQWATFLRNHDELTLEMVTDEDRETMYHAYAAERAARVNLGIRRRLAPLLRVRRKIELMNALLFSLPGTPVLYYGDEIGMGDNIYLGDRDGVRTPMQWSSDRNGGFSRANPQRLYLPTIIDPEYHYEAINVEAQQANPSSLLWWMKRLIAKRKEHRLFGRGSLEIVTADNPRVLAFVREHEGETVLVVANLSRFVQCARLELSRFDGMIPIELFGQMPFPAVTPAPYFVSLGPHGFYWLALSRPQPEVHGEPPALVVTGAWTAILAQPRRAQLARMLIAHAGQRRWFRGKARPRKRVSITDVVQLADARFAIVLLAVEYEQGAPEIYVVPVAYAEETELGDPAVRPPPAAIIASLTVTEAPGRAGPAGGVLYDAVHAEGFAMALLAAIAAGKTGTGEHGRVEGTAFAALAGPEPAAPELPAPGQPAPEPPAPEPVAPEPPAPEQVVPEASPAPRLLSVEQSNSSIAYGTSYLLKLFRVLEEGPNAELEIGRFLATRPDYHGVPALAGAIEYHGRGGREPCTLAILSRFVAHQGDAWTLALDALAHYYDRLLAGAAGAASPPSIAGSLVERALAAPSDQVIDWIGPYLDRARFLGLRTAELHLALASDPADPLFAPQPLDVMHQQSMYGSVSGRLARTFERLRGRAAALPPEQRVLADAVLAREADLDRQLARIAVRRIDAVRIRIHGDYHLAQVLWTGEDYVIIDFEGEPGRPPVQRRFERTPLRDVASMVRSFHYASAAALRDGRLRQDDASRLQGWAPPWAHWVSASFLGGYLDRARGSELVPRRVADIELLLEFCVLEQCIRELGRELEHRPEWLEIPLRGLLDH